MFQLSIIKLEIKSCPAHEEDIWNFITLDMISYNICWGSRGLVVAVLDKIVPDVSLRCGFVPTDNLIANNRSLSTHHSCDLGTFPNSVTFCKCFKKRLQSISQANEMRCFLRSLCCTFTQRWCRGSERSKAIFTPAIVPSGRRAGTCP